MSKRCLLSALCKKQVGDKVRFLGCVTGYSTQSAVVTLKHSYPKGSGDIEALVNIKLLLETMKSEHTDVGQWVHVIGYTTFVSPVVSTTPQDHRNGTAGTRIGVQALLFWVARDLDLSIYEKSMMVDVNQIATSLTPKKG